MTDMDSVTSFLPIIPPSPHQWHEDAPVQSATNRGDNRFRRLKEKRACWNFEADRHIFLRTYIIPISESLSGR